MNLHNATEEELRAELKRRKEEKEKAKLIERQEMIAKVLKHREALLEFIPHERTSCGKDDDYYGINASYHPNHGVAACARCCLLDLEEDDSDIEISVSLQMTKKRP